VGTAIESSGFKSSSKKPVRVLVSLAPADLKKEGSIYDLPIALGYLLAENKDVKVATIFGNNLLFSTSFGILAKNFFFSSFLIVNFR